MSKYLVEENTHISCALMELITQRLLNSFAFVYECPVSLDNYASIRWNLLHVEYHIHIE